MLGPKDRLELGTWNAICDVCGFKFKAFELRRRWDNYMTCSKCYEERHPQDFLRAVGERPAPPWTRPVPEDVFVVVGPNDPDSL